MASDKAALLKDVLPESPHLEAVVAHVVGEDQVPVPPQASPELVAQAKLAAAVADLSDNNRPIVEEVVRRPDINTLRDVALQLGPKQTQKLNAASTASGRKPFNDRAFQRQLFQVEAAGVVHRLVNDNQLNLAPEVKAGVSTFLDNNKDFNIRQTPVTAVVARQDSLRDIPEGHVPQVLDALKTIQRVQALAPEPQAVPALFNRGVTSAHAAAQVPQSTFVDVFQDTLGVESAKQIHDHAVKSSFRNDHALTQIFQTIKGAGVTAIDGKETVDTRMATFLAIARKNNFDVNLEALFGGLDYCDCDDCTTVLSPANYFVELLQYLRNNTLDKRKDENGNPLFPNSTDPTFNKTALDVPLKRRPDLQHLQLTCENANTLIPYVDLANEVMESFVVHQDTYPSAWSADAQSEIDVFNVHDETSNELLAQPQHTNYVAYCILLQAVYPLGLLPFHQPITAIRIYLRFLKTSRYDLLKTFQKQYATPTSGGPWSPDDDARLRALHDETLQRAVTAEFLGIIQEEYVILTKEAFWPKKFFDITGKQVLSDTEYQHRIGVRHTKEYWGYRTDAELRGSDTNAKTGLQSVKAQFLKRAGMTYVELVDLVKTKFVNPVYPAGKDLLIFQSLHFSYRFLQTLVGYKATNKRDKFKLLIEWLLIAQPAADLWVKQHEVDRGGGGQQQQQEQEECEPTISTSDMCQFVYRWFDCMANIVVLESGEGPTLPVYGRLVQNSRFTAGLAIQKQVSAAAVISHPNITTIGTLFRDGTITDYAGDDVTGAPKGNVIGTVAIDSRAYSPDGHRFMEKHKGAGDVFIVGPLLSHSELAVSISSKDSFLRYIREEEIVRWNPVVDSCNIETVRILHLDGNLLTITEWDRIQRFVRLWKRIGWTIPETDEAIPRPSPTSSGEEAVPTPRDDSVVSLDDFGPDVCTYCGGDPNANCRYCSGSVVSIPEEDMGCSKDAEMPEITPDLLDQLASIKKLQNSTGIELIKLLVFWSDISPPLYQRLFLTHDLLGVDLVFKGDSNGNYLITPTKIVDHKPVIMAALRLKLDGLAAVLNHLGLQDADLTLANISAIYRYALLAQTLLLSPLFLIQAIDAMGDPFLNATATVDFFEIFHKVTDAGFSVKQLNYVIKGIDDPLSPLAPAKVKVLKTAKTLSDGLADIDTAHPDFPTGDSNPPPTADDVAKVLALLYDPPLASQIAAFLQGTTVYATNAPAGLTIAVPAKLVPKLAYHDAPAGATGANKRSTLAVTGILTADEVAQAKGLTAVAGWSDAIDRVGKQALSFFKNNLVFIFPNTAAAIAALLAGDVAPPPPATTGTTTNPPPAVPPSPSSGGTAPVKQAFFLKFFMSYLREQLATWLVISTMAGEAGLSMEVTTTLLESILTISGSAGHPPQSAMAVLRGLKRTPSSCSAGWSGYLIPPTADTYSFVGFGQTTPASLTIDGVPLPFVTQQDDPNDVWFTDTIRLTGGRLYRFDAGGQPVPGLQWNTSRAAISTIPSSALLSDFLTAAVTRVFEKLGKAAIITSGFQLTITEINYFQAHRPDFASFDLDGMTWEAFQRILTYVNLRKSVSSPSDFDLISLFKWAATLPSGATPSAADIAGQISKATAWAKEDVQTLIGLDCYNLVDPAAYSNEITLIKLQTTLTVARDVAVDIHKLFKWANPMAKLGPSRVIADDIRNSVRARYSLDDWEQAAKPLHNELRGAQRDALVAYLVVLESLVPYGVVDADNLFDFFLIDVQMGSCLQTSRLKQAISTVQTFVQRCILGLEESNFPDIKNNSLDQKRWLWMSKQTLWTANRKVFLNPELYIVPSLRDDKSPLYVALENDLLQKDINPQALQDSIKNYLFGLDQVANLLVEGIYQDDNDTNTQTTYLVAKTRSAPYLFFYRTFDSAARPVTWTPWQPIPVDIPTYHVDALVIDAKTTHNPAGTSSQALPPSDGSYVIPYRLGKRFLIFFGQLASKSVPQHDLKDVALGTGSHASDLARLQTWEIKLGWTELRNGKWSHKQVTVDSIMEAPTSVTPPPMDMYKFVPYTKSETLAGTSTTVNYILIGVHNQDNAAVGGFEFHGAQAFVSTANIDPLTWSMRTSFHLTMSDLTDWTKNFDPVIYSLQTPGAAGFPTQRPYVLYPSSAMSTSTLHPLSGADIPFYHSFSHALLDEANQTDDLDPIFATYRSQYEDPHADKGTFGITEDTSDLTNTFSSFNELTAPYALYNWEVGFHAPMELADALLRNQKFDDALKMAHYVFNPYAGGASESRVWQWKPFSDVNTASLLEALFNQLKPHTPDEVGGPINSWRNNPFAPHVVARGRPVAYMKWTVMTYLRILIAYGDWYFRQNSLEAIPLALQCYILASHIYGPAAQRIPKRGKDAFSNAVVDLELAFPFSNQTPHPVEFSGKDLVLANIFGFATTHYFAIPDNPQLRELRNTIDDRLYKIRHCQDIDGNAISLALWDPPIDPALLVSAVAQGLSLSSFLNDLNSPMPNYRFVYLLGKAVELCAELKSMGNAFLTIKEKRDSEQLQILKAKQELTIEILHIEIRNLSLEEASKTLEALRASRNAPIYRYQHYASLAGAPVASLLETDTDYKPIVMTIPPPSTSGDLVLTENEQGELSEARSAKETNDTIGPIEVTAGALMALPIIGEKVTPWGLGISFQWGPNNFGQAAMAFSRYLRINADTHSYNSTNAGRKAVNIRQHQDRIQLANSAGYEVLNINQQMLTQLTRIKTASQEIINQQTRIAQAQETLDFLSSKYTNDELYAFLESSVRSTFKQTYTLAYDLAKKAEAAFLFERGPQAYPPPGGFIQFGYFDPARDGLQSGERLYLSLKQLESAYLEKRGHDFEIAKNVSVRALNPLALLQLRESGSCTFDIPEVLYDMDFPGHYFRRIRAVSVTVPCVVGPYTGINATLRLMAHSARTSAAGATDAGSYVQQPADGPDGSDNRFATSKVPIDSIAVSSAQNDSGVFELSFTSDRYLPFEGAGAISTWSLSLPTPLKQFDYTTITDVILNIRYTSLNGGEQLKSAASASVTAFIKSVENLSRDHGLFVLFDIASEFSTDWSRASSPSTNPLRSIPLPHLPDRLPIFTRGRDPKTILAKDLYLLSEDNFPADAYQVVASADLDPVTFTSVPGAEVPGGGLRFFRSESELDRPLGGPGIAWQIDVSGVGEKVGLKRMWLVVRYTITG